MCVCSNVQPPAAAVGKGGSRKINKCDLCSTSSLVLRLQASKCLTFLSKRGKWLNAVFIESDILPGITKQLNFHMRSFSYLHAENILKPGRDFEYVTAKPLYSYFPA